ncbi:Transmembrane and TPR repeat-containing protein 3 [Hondaea fermentalgiana]|uniref:Transmembrane and TPR repeat-containing protein 3 n=1 Tax=Hondaea fermentalgiana TaxID=2315210 RepID=A0A2R5G541_9STRA|nr:Transmembrane and TPR repeat-containing protein 3 [Hondaea fermentalgiana]|eukprot:GBG26100.1 Transmembrane and TPR repeat-containing protein 3 [Hondaea fermentalgiana]
MTVTLMVASAAPETAASYVDTVAVRIKTEETIATLKAQISSASKTSATPIGIEVAANLKLSLAPQSLMATDEVMGIIHADIQSFLLQVDTQRSNRAKASGGGDGGDGGSRRPLDDRVVLKDPELLEAEIERLRAKAQGNTSKGAGSRAEDREAAEKDAGRLKMLLVQRARLKERDARRQKMRQDYEARDVRPTGPAPPPSQRRRQGGGGGARSDERIKFANLQGRKIAIGGQGGVPLPPKPGVAAAAAAATAVYAGTLECGFVWDDVRAIRGNRDVLVGLRGDLWDLDLLKNDFWGDAMDHDKSHRSYRPLAVWTFRLDAYRGRILDGHGNAYVNPRPFHETNVLLHALASALVGWLCAVLLLAQNEAPEQRPIVANPSNGKKERGRQSSKHIVQSESRHSEEEPMDAVALPCTAAALLFAVHSIHTEAVAGLVGRADILASIFFILAIGVYERYRIASVAAALAIVSTLCKETGLTALGYFERNKDWMSDVTLFEAGLREHPTNIGALSNVGYMYMQDDSNHTKLVTARELFLRATSLHPRFVTAWLNLSVVARKLGNDTEAMHALRELLSVDPEHCRGKASLADILASRVEIAQGGAGPSQVLEALEVAEHASKNCPKVPLAHYALARLLVLKANESGEIDHAKEALATFEEALRRSDDLPLDSPEKLVHGNVLNEMALFARARDDTQTALTLWERAQAIREVSGAVLSNAAVQGWLHAVLTYGADNVKFTFPNGTEVSGLERAQELMARALEAEPNNGLVMANAGWLHEVQGNLLAAQELYMGAHKLAGDHPSIMDSMKRVQDLLEAEESAPVESV